MTVFLLVVVQFMRQPFIKFFCLSILSCGWKSLYTLHLIQKQFLEQLGVDWLRLRLLIDRCQHPMADHYAHHLQDPRRHH